ncbi:RNA polymerase sigma-70 factor (ECF subfamily) [Catalinimonas alkaloidigena]|uniref:RNA polymerase sigma factor n=1 Tax=Catalinimonas alkaloidigena TaxID=1075417 RepID=UPI002405883D|nr:sigma-70 family RNA polymerase sigma factor [Catalinimonas alkaloidigena]MDF9801334.1 RNA polymerase sigma-70 factor (ECF subfamily) [Catalinimonas alkaloidigena]
MLKEHYGIIRKLCRGYADSTEDFEDNVQEVCYQLWKSIDKFGGRSKSGTWVYRLTLNVCLYNLNKRKKSVEYPVENVLISKIADRQAQPYDSDSPVHILYQSIALLKPIDRAIIMLYLEKKEHAEIAEVVGLSLSNIGVKINRIKKQLKKIVDERSARLME